MKHIEHLDWLGGYDNVSIVRRDNEFGVWFDLYTDSGELLTKATQDLSYYRIFAGKGAFWIKDYSEGEGLGDALVKAGVVERTGNKVEFGPYDASSSEYRLTEQYA